MKQLLEPLVDLWHLFYPSICYGCSQDITVQHAPMCVDCLFDLPFTDHFEIQENELFFKFIGRVKLEHASALLYFSKKGLVQNLIHELKYQGGVEVADYLGILYGKLLVRNWRNIPDLMVPIPLHKKRLVKRGYNQATKFAEGIYKSTGIPISSYGLIKNKNISSQTDKSRSERFENVLSSFEITDPKAFENKHILILDDVCTTGATLEAAAIKFKDIDGVKISFGIIALAQS